MIVVSLPAHLQTLAKSGELVEISVSGPVTQRSILDALDREFPALTGTIRVHGTLTRRPFLRFFACGEDVSQHDPDELMPDEVANGSEPFMVIGAIAGG